MHLNTIRRSALHFFSRSLCIGKQATSRRCFSLFTKPNKLCNKHNVRAAYLLNPSCNTSSSDLKSSGNNEPNTKVFDDEDFQNILKDFSKDFGVDSDSEELLNDIKKSQSETDVDGSPSQSTSDDVQGALSHNFKKFVESDSTVIQSYEDLVSGANEDSEPYFHIDFSNTPKLPLEVKRGITGVYDIEELVEVLRNEKLLDIAVISVPKEYHYTDYLLLANARSPRHSIAVAEHVIKLYKMKKHKKDPFIIVEGEKNSNWKAIDMGNIVLHLFLEDARAFYDIESLWLVDSEFDSGGTVKADPIFDALQEQMAFFESLDAKSKATGGESLKEAT